MANGWQLQVGTLEELPLLIKAVGRGLARGEHRRGGREKILYGNENVVRHLWWTNYNENRKRNCRKTVGDRKKHDTIVNQSVGWVSGCQNTNFLSGRRLPGWSCNFSSANTREWWESDRTLVLRESLVRNRSARPCSVIHFFRIFYFLRIGLLILKLCNANAI